SLEKLGLIELKRTEGNNKYFGLVSPNKIIANIPGQINFMMKG
ncbi:TPA: ArsR family transcriptional regulator, partial [Clostridium perfringens]|nr:ArsR family transcriptional regulator [Clostridium perfringens]